MKQADFYASSGVVLDEINYNAESKTLSLVIPAVSGVQFTTEFVATLKPTTSNSNDSETSSLPAIEQIGKVVASSNSLTPSYTFTGTELYVRARVSSSALHPDPSLENQKQQAWTQPIVP
jgi:hypothetical protein